jgi:hypothetical protein
MMTRRAITTFLALAAVILGSVSCGKVIRDSRSPVYMVIVNLRAARGGSSSPTFDDFLLSDVSTNNSVFNDLGQVVLRMSPKDVGQGENPTAPTLNNEITVTRYHVAYRRADGRNTPGVDVPYPFDGGVTGTIPSGAARTLNFEIVRHVAKAEPPLAQLAAPNTTVITTITEVTFYGHDQVGNAVTVSGTITIDFGDFAD